MTLSREADQLLPPIMTPFTGLFQQMQCDPEPTAFPVHSQTLQPSPFVTESLLSFSAPPLPAPEKRRSHRMGFLPHNGWGQGRYREYIPFLQAARQGFGKRMSASWSVMARPKIQGNCWPDWSLCTEPQMFCKEKLRKVMPVQIHILKKWEEMRDFQIQAQQGKESSYKENLWFKQCSKRQVKERDSRWGFTIPATQEADLGGGMVTTRDTADVVEGHRMAQNATSSLLHVPPIENIPES